jgi:hypothetical protein
MMLTIRTAVQIRGTGNLRSFRACAVSTGVSVWRADARRVVQAEARRANSEVRRRWLAGHWDAHQMRARREGAS